MSVGGKKGVSRSVSVSRPMSADGENLIVALKTVELPTKIIAPCGSTLSGLHGYQARVSYIGRDRVGRVGYMGLSYLDR